MPTNKRNKKREMHPLLRVTSGVILTMLKLGTALVIMLYLLSAYSPLMSPEKAVLPALLGLVFPILLTAVILLLLFWLLAARWSMVAPIVLALILSWGSISVYIPFHKAKPLDELKEGTLKVLSYNVMSFGYETHSEKNPNRILLYIKNSDADIVCMQEAEIYPDNSEFVSMRVLRKFLPQYPYRRKVNSQQQKGSGLLVLSKYPIRSAKVLPLKSDFNGAALFKIDVNGKQIHVINCHLESFKLTLDEGEQYLQLAKGGHANDLKEKVGTKFTPAYRKRAAQADLLAQTIQDLDAKRLIVCGDFNDTPISYVRKKISEGLHDAYALSGRGPGFSFEKRYFVVRIDHILCSKTFNPINCRVDKTIAASDHYPIYTYLESDEK